MIVRPYGIVLQGHLELGWELLLNDGVVEEIRPHTGVPEAYVISPAFVNAHSHLEYRGLMGRISAEDYWPWIRELTELKRAQTAEEVQTDCFVAAHENRSTGVAMIGEHSDRPYSGAALSAVGIGGVLYQELITFFEHLSPAEKLVSVRAKAAAQATQFEGEMRIAPHAPYTVDAATLSSFSEGDPFSIHVAETVYENQWIRSGEGPMADFQRAAGYSVEPKGKSVVSWLNELGLVRRGAQFVHCCDVSDEDLSLMASAGVTLAHCPRSNVRLRCPAAPVRRMLDMGIPVGLGLDSAASSGPIDMFEEMRSALALSWAQAHLTGEQIWKMATDMGHRSLGMEGDWGICEGSPTPLIRIHVQGAHTTDDLIMLGSPEAVEWLD